MLLLGALMLGIVVLNCANVAGRYLFLAPVPAADELMTFGMVWGVFLGAGLVTLRGDHLRMGLLTDLARPALGRALDRAACLALVVVPGFVAWHSLDYLDMLGTIGLTSMSAGLPMAWIHAAIPIGFALVMLAALLRLFVPLR